MRRDRPVFHWALVASLLLHLLLVLVVLPAARDVYPSPRTPLVQVAPEPEQRPLEFEFVDLAEDREATPADETAPMSDLDRRAGGGEGEAAASPGVEGTTQQLVESEGGDRLGRAAPPQQPIPAPEPRREVPPRERPAEQPSPEELVYREGAGEPEEQAPEPEPPALKLPPSAARVLPPDTGGLLERPDRTGGQVDEGTLSFDTQWYDWGPYARMMIAKIRRHWDIPQIARMGVSGRVRIRFFIERDGTVTGLQIMDESGKPPMDFAARDAIADSSPFNPLPANLPTGIDREGVTITFYYNMDIPTR